MPRLGVCPQVVGQLDGTLGVQANLRGRVVAALPDDIRRIAYRLPAVEAAIVRSDGYARVGKVLSFDSHSSCTAWTATISASPGIFSALLMKARSRLSFRRFRTKYCSMSSMASVRMCCSTSAAGRRSGRL